MHGIHEDADDRGIVVGCLGNAEGFFSHGAALNQRGTIRKLFAEMTEQERPVDSITGYAFQCCLENLHFLSIKGSHRRPAESQRGRDQPLGVTDIYRTSSRVEQYLPKSRISGLSLGRTEPDDQVEFEG